MLNLHLIIWFAPVVCPMVFVVFHGNVIKSIMSTVQDLFSQLFHLSQFSFSISYTNIYSICYGWYALVTNHTLTNDKHFVWNIKEKNQWNDRWNRYFFIHELNVCNFFNFTTPLFLKNSNVTKKPPNKQWFIF